MRNLKILSQIGFALILVVLIANPSAAAPVDAYYGFVDNTRVNEGDTVRFSGSFHNYLGSTVHLFSMNVTFVERLGTGSVRDPERPNITKVYERTRNSVASNSTLTDSITDNIEFSPGSYNVSIFFVYTNDTQVSAGSQFGTVYALANATFVVEGLTQTLKVFRNIGIVLGVLAIAVIGYLFYNSKFKK